MPSGTRGRDGSSRVGHDLSGGEWQRLALARIRYRDADLWILDEPTASLDPEAESAVFTELEANLRGRIGIAISHRSSTVRATIRAAGVRLSLIPDCRRRCHAAGGVCCASVIMSP